MLEKWLNFKTVYMYRGSESLLENTSSLPRGLSIDSTFDLRSRNYDYFIFQYCHAAPS